MRDARRMGARRVADPSDRARCRRSARPPTLPASPTTISRLAPRFQGAPEDRRHAPAEPDRAASHARGQLVRLPHPRSHLHGGRGALLVKAGMAAHEEGVARLHRHRRLRGLCLPRDQDQHLAASLRCAREARLQGEPALEWTGGVLGHGLRRGAGARGSAPRRPGRVRGARPNAAACRTCAPSAGCFD